MDGAEIDVWIGTNKEKKIDVIMCTIDLTKKDSEIKILIGCTEEEKVKIFHSHNTAKMKGILIRRL
jgi:inorganic pyrophosphatase